jgi:hypothetical protein
MLQRQNTKHVIAKRMKVSIHSLSGVSNDVDVNPITTEGRSNDVKIDIITDAEIGLPNMNKNIDTPSNGNDRIIDIGRLSAATGAVTVTT